MPEVLSVEAAINIAQDFVKNNDPPFIVIGVGPVFYGSYPNEKGRWLVVLVPYKNGEVDLNDPDAIELYIYPEDGRLEIAARRE